MKQTITTALACIACTAMGAYVYSRVALAEENQQTALASAQTFQGQQLPVMHVSSTTPTDFTSAAQKSINSVVHVKILQEQRQQTGMSDPFFQFFFGPRLQPSQPQGPQLVGSGSGVIIGVDGYIITNNHVIESADKIQVTLNDRRTFEASVIGTDPTTDIALIKIEAENLVPLAFGNSDALQVGEWVLAVGNPFNLTSTVTAGIVSAKQRGMGAINGQNQIGIESFIQTDAAVNPGNSGGALVNTHGELIGINTAIASNTGSYTGYSFAVPSNIVIKIAEDLKQYGEAQRAMLGITIAEVNQELAQQHNLSQPQGVMVMDIQENGAAKAAGIEIDDVITHIDGERVNTVPELQEQVARRRPGDTIKIKVLRNGKEKDFSCTLRNLRGTTDVVKNTKDENTLGAQLAELTSADKQKYNISFGLKVKNIGNGKLKEAGVRDGFVILRINRQPVRSIDEFNQMLKSAYDAVMIQGIYPNGKIAYYAINMQE